MAMYAIDCTVITCNYVTLSGPVEGAVGVGSAPCDPLRFVPAAPGVAHMDLSRGPNGAPKGPMGIGYGPPIEPDVRP